MIIIVKFQIYARYFIVLAVSREWCVFHDDDMWTSTRGRVGLISRGQEEGVKNRISLWTS